jgi:hypothetical protein
MEGLLQGVVDSPPRILVPIRPGGKHVPPLPVTPGGFRWWADKQAQTIEIIGEMEGGPDGAVGYVVRVQTDVLRGVDLDAPRLSAINSAIMSFASMSGLVHDVEARTLSFSSLARVWDQNEAWLNPFISMAAVLQIGEARILAEVELLQRESTPTQH